MDHDLLLVYSEPGQVPVEEFHDWYDHEHVPLRMQFPQFRTGYRFRAADGRAPGWLATYDVEPGFLDTDAYTALRAHRSEREQHVVQRLATLDRRRYSLVHEAGRLDGEPRYQVLVGLTSPDEEGLRTWYEEEHIPLLIAIEGWDRVRQFRLQDGPGETLLTVHDIAHPSLCETAKWKHATSTPWRARVMASVTASSRRVFAFHHAGR
ncbi:hypothetical protein [Tersicoccus sp. Bi-70]|uniref:hypothetical protein n=1 Tax=Tersicoccus sp. Bi-70 TaxID=1897634 RepID=UPI0009765147|nr:hypothetical protein [Tersicoccus sp. Bi-70]OMH36670.1 hypothetical protein BGP79_12745 [Tersicoccus sp. Bi-70]